MSDQILSQEEIDALLSAMDRGDVDLEQEIKGEAVVQPYNLTSQNAMLRSQFFALEEVYDKFSTLLDNELPSMLQCSIDVEFVSTEMVKYGQFISAFSSPTSLNIFNMEPLIGSGLMAIEPKLVFSLIDCMFGGNGKELIQVRDFTMIEQRMIEKFAVEILKIFEEAWTVVHEVKVSLKKAETKPEYVHLVNPNELMIIIVFSVKGPEFSGNLHFCISCLMLEPIKDKLSSKFQGEKDLDFTWRNKLRDLLYDTQVDIIAELGNTNQTIKDILTLKVDDVINLGTGPQDSIVLNVCGVPKYKGFPGIIKGNRAVEITELIKTRG